MSSFSSWLTRLKGYVVRPAQREKDRPLAQRWSRRPVVEQLEPRMAPALFELLASFGSTTNFTGANPAAGLVQTQGSLYGTTMNGGAHSTGTVFNTASGTVYDFGTNGTDGSNPDSGLATDGTGNLFGTTLNGGTGSSGTAFELQGSTLTTIYAFMGGTTDGLKPSGNLYRDGSGNLFGTTQNGGSNNDGTIFELSPPTSGTTYTETALYSFTGSNGANPIGGVTADAAGDLFGTTQNGGTNGTGTVFELKAGSSTITPLYSFSALSSGTNSDGANPTAGVVVDGSGNLFGTTQNGGTSGDGTVFELLNNSGSYTLKTLHTFSGSDGANPTGGVIEDGNGNLFGTTQKGGTSNNGTVFELSPSGTGYTINTLHVFAGGSNDGANPTGDLVQNKTTGNLFGTTQNGGVNGTVFQLGTPQNLAPNSGDGQTAAVNTQLPNALVVKVTDNAGDPVPGVTVHWAAASGGGSVSAQTSVTDSNGLASVNATLGSASGGNTYTATVSGLTGSPVTFNATALVPTTISLSSGNNQSATAGTTLGQQFQVKVTDSNGAAVPGVTVNWAATSGGGSVSAKTSVTNSSGIASVNATLGTAAGTDTFTATVSGLTGSPVSFTATATAGTATTVAAFAGNNQTGLAGNTLASALQVKVTDANGNPISGVTVTWAVASGGGSVSAATTTTNSSGIASVVATLGSTPGANSYTATASGLTGSPVTFNETGNSQPPPPTNSNAGALIQGVAFIDGNGTGLRTETDSVLANATIQLVGTTTSGTAVSRTTTTNAAGFYSFTNLQPGTYQLVTSQDPLSTDGSTGASFTLTNGQIATMDVSFVGLTNAGLSLRLLLASGGFPYGTPADNAPVAVNPIQNVSVLTATTTGVTNGSTTVSGLGSVFNNLTAGMQVSGAGIPTGTTVFSVDSQNQQITLSNGFTGTTGASTTLFFGTNVINLAGTFSEPDMTDPIVTFTVTAGGQQTTYQVELFGKITPQTVANFLSYVRSGEYNTTVFHRVQNPATDGLGIVQGGGFQFVPQTNPPTSKDAQLKPITTDPDVPSEANISNTPFTLAMALSGGSNGQTNPNSGNSEFFFNTVDNSGSLNPQGFTVFGKVLSASQTAFSNLATPMIAAGTNETLQGGTTEIPLYNGYPANSSSFPGDTVANNYALITNVQVTTPSAATLTYSASVSGANPNLVSVSFGSDLNGFDKNLLVLNYTPGQTGTATITVTATNQNGVSVTTTFTVTVS